MGSLKARFALLVGSAAVLVILAAGGLFWALHAAETALERSLAAQARLDLLTELSGRLSDYGLATVDAVGALSPGRGRITGARADLERALGAVDAKLAETVAQTETLLGRTELAARSRPLARLRASLALLDRQIEAALDQGEPAARNDAVRGALNGFGAISGPLLSFLVEAERRAVESASAQARALTDRLRIGALAVAAAALLAVALMHRAITRPLLKRIDAIRDAAGAIGRGELDVRLPLQTRDELGLLVAGFNRMAGRLRRRERQVVRDRAALEETIAQRTADLRAANDRLEGIDRSRRRFFTDVSHELRTPLTVILGECDIGLRGAAAGEPAQRSTLATIRKRAQGLHRRVEDLLRVARSESGQIELNLRWTSALPILTEAVEAMSTQAARRGVRLDLDPGRTDLEVRADPEWLRQIVEGLIDNALRHASGATGIAVALEEGPLGPRISVTDDGAGLSGPDGDPFERFARGGERGGFGIGLALARWVVERHDGTIRLEAGPAGGVRATIDLPAAERRETAA